MKIKLTIAQALAILDGIAIIFNGYETIITEKDAKGASVDRAVKLTYKIDAHSAARLKMNYKSLQATGISQIIKEASDEILNEILKRFTDGRTELSFKETPKEFVEYQTALNRVAADEIEVDLYKIDQEKLLEKNDNILPHLMKLDAILNVAALSD